jgi:serine/threonine protein kinase
MTTQHFGRYEIKIELGRGGMATVFHAYDPYFERDVAIKVLPQAFLHDPQFRARFNREAKMIALLEHPAIVPVYDFGEEESQPFIVMRYMAGGSLADRLNQGGISLEETSRIITRLAPALDAAHSRGIIHRDLKPGNILFDQYGNAFLSDFGIARLTQTAATTLTGESIVGTPAYMSPEQIQGDKTIDGRSDIYALGVLIYQMLTGCTPYKSDTPAKVMMMHVLEPVPHILEAKADLPKTCDSVIERAMAKDPDARFSTTGELADVLEATTKGIVADNATPIGLKNDQTVVAAPRTQPGMPTSAATVVSTSQPAIIQPPVSAPHPVPIVEKKRSPLMMIVILALVVLVGGAIVIGGVSYLGGQGNDPNALIAGATETRAPSVTPLPPTEETEVMPTTVIPIAVIASPTPEPSQPPTEVPAPTTTPTQTPQPSGPIIGGADKIAYLNSDNVWMANLDGTELTQLTTDSTLKSSLQWHPDGESITYIVGKCIQRLWVESGEIEEITCLTGVDTIKSFDVSNNGKRVAIILDNQMYIVPFDTEKLAQVTKHSDLAAMADCEHFAPYLRNFISQVRWSDDSNTIAAKLIANLGDGRRGDIIQLFRVDQCIPNPRAIDNFPPPRFEMDGYDKIPAIPNYAWDGTALFAFHNVIRNDGFGDLYAYNTELYKAYPDINPTGSCCYRDPAFSPDGEYLLFAFQDYLGGASSTTQIYYVPYASIGTGASFEPLPIPEITNPKEKPQPILRAAQSDG